MAKRIELPETANCNEQAIAYMLRKAIGGKGKIEAENNKVTVNFADRQLQGTVSVIVQHGTGGKRKPALLVHVSAPAGLVIPISLAKMGVFMYVFFNVGGGASIITFLALSVLFLLFSRTYWNDAGQVVMEVLEKGFAER